MAYQYGSLPEELEVEELIDGNWVKIEKSIIEEEIDNSESDEDILTTEEEQKASTYYKGEFRLKYEIISIVEEEQVVENGYVYLTIIEEDNSEEIKNA